MRIVIEGTAKEIAAFVEGIQKRQEDEEVPVMFVESKPHLGADDRIEIKQC